MATRSRMMDGLCLHLVSGRHSKIINKYAASFFFCLRVLLSVFQNEHKDTQKKFSSTSTWSQTHSWGLYETSAHMHTLTHTKHSSKSSNAAEIFPPSPTIQGCFYGNKIQFLALKRGKLQEVWAASKRRAWVLLEDWVGEFGVQEEGCCVGADFRWMLNSMHGLNQ